MPTRRVDTTQACPNCNTGTDDSVICIVGDSDTENPDIKIRTKMRACTFCRHAYATFEHVDQSAVKGVFTKMPNKE